MLLGVIEIKVLSKPKSYDWIKQKLVNSASVLRFDPVAIVWMI